MPPAELHATYRQHNGPLWRDYGRGLITKAQLKRRRFAHTLAALGVEMDADAASARYLHHYARRWEWTDGAQAAFRAIAERRPVGVLTNGFAEQQRGKLARFPEIEPACAPGAVLIAEEIGAWKPSPEAFARATAAAGVAPERILYVGDSLRSDVEGATAAGWAVAWWRGDAAHPEHGRRAVHAWDEVVRLAGV